jgi:ketosteroid isomerase-like protein
MRRLVLFVLVIAVGAPGCGSDETAPEEVWGEFVEAVNLGDIDTVEELLAPDVEWTWDSNLLAIHRSASGREETVAGIEDLIGRGVTLDSDVIEVVDDTVTAETLFHEPELADRLAGRTLVQRDVVETSDGEIVTWTCTAETITRGG